MAPNKSEISDRLFRLDDGSWAGRYSDMVLKTAFQPIFKFQAGKLRPVAFEGLLRPFTADAPMLTGAFFKSIAPQDIGLVESISRTLHVRNAAKLNAKARRLFVNFDPSALSSKSTFEALLDDLGAELRVSDLTSADCVCEITEHAAKSEDDLKFFVYALRARGYLIAVDDFGADSSDMDRIAALTPDIVKIDGPMAKELMNSPEGFKQLKALIESFHQLRINTVVEGLEEMWQIEMAEAAKVDMVQGFAAAVPRILPNNFDEWFEDDELKPSIIPSRPASG